jgi:hypothetical protein
MDHNWKGKIADFGLSHVKKRKVCLAALASPLFVFLRRLTF